MMSVMRSRVGAVVCVVALVVGGCSLEGLFGSGSGGGSTGPDGFEKTQSATDERLGAGAGLCAWVAPERLEEIFGSRVDAYALGPDAGCRVVAEGDFTLSGIYHVALDQTMGFDETNRLMKAGGPRNGYEFCDRESSRWRGMRIQRDVTCPGADATRSYRPEVMLELADGRVLRNKPQGRADEASAVEASHVFVELLKAFAEQMQGLPLLNEVKPGAWVEVFNPGEVPVDLTGFTVVQDDTDGAVEFGVVEVPAGTTVAPGGLVVIDLDGEQGAGQRVMTNLVDPDGRTVDRVKMRFDELNRGPVLRRNGDGGVWCSGFGSPDVTKGKPNPPFEERCGEN